MVRKDGRNGSVWLPALLAVAPVIAAAAISSSVTTPSLAPWHAALAKPWFNPPNWVFGPVWSALYALMAYAAWRVLRRPARTAWRLEGLALFFLQLAFGCLWSVAFFGLRSPGLGVIVIIALFAVIGLTMLAFTQVDEAAGWLLAPTLAWVGFATLLNIEIWRLN